MRYILLITTFWVQSALCQGDNTADSLKIVYRYGSYYSGKIKVKEEVFTLFPVSNNVFQVRNNSARKSLRTDNELPLKKLESLLNELDSSKDNFDFRTIKPHLKTLQETEIIEIAKKNKVSVRLIDPETGKADQQGRKIIMKLQSYEYIDSFLYLNKPTIGEISVSTNIVNHLTIYRFHKNDTIKYSLVLYNLLGQPFTRRQSNDPTTEQDFINVLVNSALQGILPSNSKARKAVGFDQLTEHYVIWYLKREL